LEGVAKFLHYDNNKNKFGFFFCFSVKFEINAIFFGEIHQPFETKNLRKKKKKKKRIKE
jgi:hypothetical protein